MKYRGIVYDVGLDFNNDGKLSVQRFDPQLVDYDMRVISKELYANAVRIEGEDISRLVEATRIAHQKGLTVLFNPWKMHATVEETETFVRQAAQAAEALRQEGVDIIFVTSCEFSLFCKGIFPGDTFSERLAWMVDQRPAVREPNATPQLPATLLEASSKLNDALQKCVRVVRTVFTGQVTYSAGTWELVDWSVFDIVGIDYYRNGEAEEEYIQGLERYRTGKPIAVREFGCCAYEGAAERGAGGFMLLQGMNEDGSAKFVDDVVPVRSEDEQADYLATQLQLLERMGVQAAFVYVFSFPLYPAGEGKRDLDMMSFSLVKTAPPHEEQSSKMPPWERKKAFNRVAQIYRELSAL